MPVVQLRFEVSSDLNAASRLLDHVGNTPLLRFNKLFPTRANSLIVGKAEWFNPGGSVKDRAVGQIIREGEASGALTKNTRILDATSGNAGISYAMLGAALGYGVRLTIPKSASRERLKILETLGVEITLTDALEGSDGAIRRAKEIYQENPSRYFYGDQYNNSANWRAHYKGTANEIWRQTSGTVTHLVVGVGTSGTLVGTAKRLRELNPSVKVVEVQPDSPFHGLEGLKHMESALIPGFYDSTIADRLIRVRTEEAQRIVRKVAREEGVLIGVSAGAALYAAGKIAEEDGGVFAVILPDGGERYLSERFWEDRSLDA
jgi:cysteine synthase B